MVTGEVIFYRRGWYTFASLAIAVQFCVAAVLYLVWFRDYLTFGLYSLSALLWVIISIHYSLPYIRISAENLVVSIAPLRPKRLVHWESVKALRHVKPKVIELSMEEGKPLKLHLRSLKDTQRVALISILEKYLPGFGEPNQIRNKPEDESKEEDNWF